MNQNKERNPERSILKIVSDLYMYYCVICIYFYKLKQYEIIIYRSVHISGDIVMFKNDSATLRTIVLADERR